MKAKRVEFLCPGRPFMKTVSNYGWRGLDKEVVTMSNKDYF